MNFNDLTCTDNNVATFMGNSNIRHKILIRSRGKT